MARLLVGTETDLELGRDAELVLPTAAATATGLLHRSPVGQVEGRKNVPRAKPGYPGIAAARGCQYPSAFSSSSRHA